MQIPLEQLKFGLEPPKEEAQFEKQLKEAKEQLYTDKYFSFLEKCILDVPYYDEGDLNGIGAQFSQHSMSIYYEIQRFKVESSNYPLMAIIFLWAQWISDDRVLGEKYLDMMQGLLTNNLLPHFHPVLEKPIDMAEFATWDPSTAVENIRSFKDWSIEKREGYVKFYCEFSYWLSKHTFGFIPIAVDRDREITKQRKLPFDDYIKFLSSLDLRERIMVKIFYLGGAVALEDVLSIQIEDIDFTSQIVFLGSEKMVFSQHVLDDLKGLIADRKKGYVFIGRQNERINHTVPYRALKSVAAKLGKDSSFTFKEFVKNQ